MFSRKKKSAKSSASTSTGAGVSSSFVPRSIPKQPSSQQPPAGGLMQLDEHERMELQNEIMHHRKRVEDFYGQLEVLLREGGENEFSKERWRIETVLAPILFGTPFENHENHPGLRSRRPSSSESSLTHSEPVEDSEEEAATTTSSLAE